MMVYQDELANAFKDKDYVIEIANSFEQLKDLFKCIKNDFLDV